MPEPVLAVHHLDTDVFTAVGMAGILPVHEIARMRQRYAVLFEKAPVFAGFLPVLKQIRVDHAPHLRIGNRIPFDPQQLGSVPVDQIIRTPQPDPAVRIAVLFAVFAAVSLAAEAETAAETDDAAGTRIIQRPVPLRQLPDRSEVYEVGAGRHGQIQIDGAVLFRLHQREIQIEASVAVENRRIAVCRLRIAAKQHGRRERLPVQSHDFPLSL